MSQFDHRHDFSHNDERGSNEPPLEERLEVLRSEAKDMLARHSIGGAQRVVENAIDLVDQEALGDPDQRADVREWGAKLLRECEALREADLRAAEARALRGTDGTEIDSLDQLPGMILHAQVLLDMGRADEAASILEVADREEIKDLIPLFHRFVATVELARSDYHRDDMQAYDSRIRALRHYSSLLIGSDRERIADYMLDVSAREMRIGHFDPADQLSALSAELLRVVRKPLGVALALSMNADAKEKLGIFSEARALRSSCLLDVSNLAGPDDAWAFTMRSKLVDNLIECGDFRIAESVIHDGFIGKQPTGSKEVAVLTALSLVDVKKQLGNLSEALRDLDALAKIEGLNPTIVSYQSKMTVEILGALGYRDRAQAFINEKLERVNELPFPDGAISELELLLAKTQPGMKPSTAILKECCDSAEEVLACLPPDRASAFHPTMERLRARIAFSEGDYTLAMKLFPRAVDSFAVAYGQGNCVEYAELMLEFSAALFECKRHESAERILTQALRRLQGHQRMETAQYGRVLLQLGHCYGDETVADQLIQTGATLIADWNSQVLAERLNYERK